MKRIVHYNVKDCSTIKPLSELNLTRILDAKQLRGGENHHEKQCNSIPDVIDAKRHGIHLTPCYKKFTLILSSQKKSPKTTDARHMT